jgi:inner membrane protein
MATVGHVAAGLVAARGFHDGRRPRLTDALWWSAVALLPDADVIGFPLGVHYEAPWGHRGAAHSLVFAVAVGVLLGFAARWFKRPVARTMFWTSVAIGSHGLLDTLTDGGLGCALLWPFDLTRYFAPWRPIPVAPIGLGMLSAYGLIVVVTECVFFAPLLFVALRSTSVRRSAPATLGLITGAWLAVMWLFVSTDPVRERVVAFILRDQTMFSGGYSEQSFRSIAKGASDEDVRRLLGTPYGEGWFYRERDCRSLRFEKGAAVLAYEVEACRNLGVQLGTPLADVRRILGAPSESCWVYSWSPRFAFRLRMVCFDHTTVDGVVSSWALTE